MAKYKITINEGTRLTEHFWLHEFFCNSCNECYIDSIFLYTFVPLLEDFRSWYNRPINITSAYRPAEFNKKVGGSSNSAHLKAWAVDFPYPADYKRWGKLRQNEFLTNVKSKWTELSHSYGVFAQCNFYDNRFHLGISTKNDNYLDYRTK